MRYEIHFVIKINEHLKNVMFNILRITKRKGQGVFKLRQNPTWRPSIKETRELQAKVDKAADLIAQFDKKLKL